MMDIDKDFFSLISAASAIATASAADDGGSDGVRCAMRSNLLITHPSIQLG